MNLQHNDLFENYQKKATFAHIKVKTDAREWFSSFGFIHILILI